VTEATTRSRNNAANTRGRPFRKGNQGRPKGARHKVTLAVQALLDGEAEALTRVAVEKALDGDSTALRLCMDRIAPTPKDRPVSFDLPSIDTSGGIVEAISAVAEAMSSGDLTPNEATGVAALLEIQRRALETHELEERLTTLEQQQTKRR